MSVESYESVKETIDLLNPCMDDYLYVYDLKEDRYKISEHAMERFNLPCSEFQKVLETHKKFVFEADYQLLVDDLEGCINGTVDFHNLKYRWLNRALQPVWINCRGRVIRDENGSPLYLIGCINEIGKKPQADNESGLMGEGGLWNELQKVSFEGRKGFLLRIGIDNFKDVNESRGMQYGNMILRRTAECISDVMRPQQMLFRFEADEYVVLDLNGGTIQDADFLYQKISWTVNSFIEENGYEVFYTLSAGILDIAEAEDNNYETFARLSEFALRQAKLSGRNKSYVFNMDEYNQFVRRRELLRMMRRSIRNRFEGFEAYFQPIYDLQRKEIICAETLLRFRTPLGEMISPVEFIPMLEESGLMIPVGKWVLQRAMEACYELQQKKKDFRVTVNLSYVQVLKSNVLTEILRGVEEHRLRPGSLIMELTESGFIESNENFINFCQGLKENGVALALDDFGTGYSNFHYINEISPNIIKIDRGFTLKALKDGYDRNLLRHMIDMIHDVNLQICIEGVETQEDLDSMCELGPDYIQGYFFGKPGPIENLLDLL